MHLAILRLWPRLVIRKMQPIPLNFHHLCVTSSQIFPIQSLSHSYLQPLGPLSLVTREKNTHEKLAHWTPFYCSVVLECRECYIFFYVEWFWITFIYVRSSYQYFYLKHSVIERFLFLVTVVIVFPHNRIRFVVKHI